MSEETFERVLQPKEMTKILFQHQLAAIFQMEHRERTQTICSENFCINTNMGIFADISGYGKTLSLIGLVLRDKMVWDTTSPFIVSNICNMYGNGSIIKKSLLRFQKMNTTLIVASTSILKQWSEEISFTPLKHIIVTNRKKLDTLEPTLYDIILYSPSVHNYIVNKYPNYAWKRFIYDEPTQTRIPAMRCVIAGFIWFVTATPTQLLYRNHNSHNFLQNVFSNCMDYHIFQNLIIKNPDDFVRQSFELPKLIHYYYQCHQPLYTLVRDILSDAICNMIDAGNIEKAVRHLGGTSTSNIFDLIRNEKQEQLLEVKYKIEKFTRLQDLHRQKKWEEKKIQIEEEIVELERRYRYFILNEICQVCLHTIERPVLLSCCQNAYCGKCILAWLKTQNICPNCRASVMSDMIIYLQTDTDATSCTTNEVPHMAGQEIIPKKKTKPEMVLDIIARNPSGKVLIFSNYDETFSIIRNALQEDGLSFAEISGTMEMRHKKLKAFRQGELNILFINSLANGAGINLQETTDIILYHRMCEHIEVQIIARAHRIGRTGSLHVHHLL